MDRFDQLSVHHSWADVIGEILPMEGQLQQSRTCHTFQVYSKKTKTWTSLKHITSNANYYWNYLRAVSRKSRTSTKVYVKSSNDMLHLHPISKVSRKGLPKPCQVTCDRITQLHCRTCWANVLAHRITHQSSLTGGGDENRIAHCNLSSTCNVLQRVNKTTVIKVTGNIKVIGYWLGIVQITTNINMELAQLFLNRKKTERKQIKISFSKFVRFIHCIERSRNESDVSGLHEERDTHNATVASSSSEIPFCLTRRRIKQTSLICAKCSGALRERPIEVCKLPCDTRSSIVGALAKLFDHERRTRS
ncbi:hypothetical protein G5I_10109 [Acromyrmex echinatior]|uniref:Uncharacterized protein n=1 Tax=Acromyrmex echinatior TaxID=103372 RepID=F4WW75_ACREC|nr:hypothetical protein G5I_10109 [Acromyrmex echinatior]